jgi:predicted RNase H-like HicB family nuclease
LERRRLVCWQQGETLKELQENIDDAYHVMLETAAAPTHPGAQTLELEIEV